MSRMSARATSMTTSSERALFCLNPVLERPALPLSVELRPSSRDPEQQNQAEEHPRAEPTHRW